MTNPDPSVSPSRETAEAIHREHESLRQLLARIRATQDLGTLIPQLEHLRQELEEHFATEERPDGLHRVISTREPRYVKRLEEILEEHRSFLADLDRILGAARESLQGLSGVFHDVENLVLRLHAHEARETQLLTDTAYIDLGGGA